MPNATAPVKLTYTIVCPRHRLIAKIEHVSADAPAPTHVRCMYYDQVSEFDGGAVCCNLYCSIITAAQD